MLVAFIGELVTDILNCSRLSTNLREKHLLMSSFTLIGVLIFPTYGGREIGGFVDRRQIRFLFFVPLLRSRLDEVRNIADGSTNRALCNAQGLSDFTLE